MIAPPRPPTLAVQKRDPEFLSRYTVASENLLVLAHIYTATAALVLGALFGLLQSFARVNLVDLPPFLDYYRMLTAHGVLLALVFTTFFIVGLCAFTLYRCMPKPGRSLKLGWSAYWLMLVGTVMAAAAILSGNASVLYTFYAPLKATPWFYFGATFLILGTWIFAAEVLGIVTTWKRAHRGERIPLPAFIVATTFAMWIIATLGVVAEMAILIPWSLGWTPGVDVELTRMLFWYFGHPLVYFWIMGAYLVWYTIVPTTFGGRVFSDALTRLSFIFLLLLSTPVGLHHQFLDPGIGSGWKWLHMALTYGVVIPSFMTAFALFATFEIAAKRAGRRGFVQTIRWLPWKDPVFSGCALGMLLFVPGGFGGIVNASYSMDVLVHNTMWIVGHFHITVGGPVALTFMATAYKIVPIVTGRKLFAPRVALVQTYLWFVGMCVMSLSMHWAGLLGAPRRASDVSYGGSAIAAVWHPEMVASAVGGAMLFLSIMMFAYVALGTRLQDARDAEPLAFSFALTDEHAMLTPPVFDHIGRWAVAALVLAVLSYSGPFAEYLSTGHHLAPGMRTW